MARRCDGIATNGFGSLAYKVFSAVNGAVYRFGDVSGD
jgi:hypothetical protein